MHTEAKSTSIIEFADALLPMLQNALVMRNQEVWSGWLQGEIQRFLPHDVLIAAWGDFEGGGVAYDVISRGPAAWMQALPRHSIEAMMLALFQTWLRADQQPVGIDGSDLRCGEHPDLPATARALVHGMRDHRARSDCLYVFIGRQQLVNPLSLQLCRLALPFIDFGFRQLADRGQKLAASEPHDDADAANWSFAVSTFPEPPGHADSAFRGRAWADSVSGGRGSLSARELEIMQWVRMGKTNSEIAMILDLSTFTVKNHMRRIYKKLDVLNRAQAVSSLDRMQGMLQFAAR